MPSWPSPLRDFAPETQFQFQPQPERSFKKGGGISPLLWLLTVLVGLSAGPVKAQSLSAFRSEPLWERAGSNSASLGPLRSVHDGKGGVFLVFTPQDWVNGQRVGMPIKLRESDGGIDSSFQPGTYVQPGPNAYGVHAAAAQSDGKLVVAMDREDHVEICRLLANGQPDASFQIQRLNQSVRFLTLQPDGGILVLVFGFVNEVTVPGGLSVSQPTLLRLKGNGEPDAAFNRPVFEQSFLAVPPLLDPQGRIYLAGRFVLNNAANSYTNLVRLLPDGTPDDTYAASRSLPVAWGGIIRGTGFQSDGKLVVVGDLRLPNTSPAQVPPASRNTNQFMAARFDLDGRFDPTFAMIRRSDLAASDYPRMLVVQADDKLVVAANGLRRMNADGTADGSFKAVDTGFVSFVSQFSDGRLLLPGGESEHGVLAFLPDGTPDPAFVVNGFGTTQSPASFAVLDSGAVVVAGAFNRVGQTHQEGLALLDSASGTLISTQPNLGQLHPGVIVQSGLGSQLRVAAGPEGSLYYAAKLPYPSGVFDGNGASGFEGLRRMKPDGSVDAGFVALEAALGGELDVLADGEGGVWLTRNGPQVAYDQAVGAAVAWFWLDHRTASGNRAVGFAGLEESLRQQLGAVVGEEQLLVGDLRILCRRPAGGLLAAVTTVLPSTRVIKLKPDGSMEDSFQAPEISGLPLVQNFPELLNRLTGTFAPPVNGALEVAEHLFRGGAELSDSSVLVVGKFTKLNDHPLPGIALLRPDGSIDTSFHPPEFVRTNAVGGVTLFAVAADASDRIYVAGLFDRVNGQPATGIVRLNRRGEVDPAFKCPLVLTDYPLAQATLVLDGRNLWAAGSFCGSGETFPRPVWKLSLGRALQLDPVVEVTASVVTLRLSCEGGCSMEDAAATTIERSDDLGRWDAVTVVPQLAEGKLVLQMPTATGVSAFYRARMN